MTKKQQSKTVIIFQGSPRKKGNTAVVTQWLEEALESQGWKIKTYPLYNMKFRGCSHCDACKKVHDKPGCILKDDLETALNTIPKADILIIASPVYCWSVSGCASAFMDRLYSFIKPEGSLLANKKMIGLFTAGGDAFDGIDLCVEMLKRFCEYTKVTYVDTIAAANCTTPRELLKNKTLKRSIIQLTKRLSVSM